MQLAGELAFLRLIVLESDVCNVKHNGAAARLGFALLVIS